MTLRIDRYEVDRLVGEGAFGKVYLAFDPRIGRRVAVKVLASGNAEADTRQRFRLEARAIAALKHPNIVELYDYSGENAPDLFLVMEYVEGRSLDVFMSQLGPFSEPTALCVGHELCLALGHAHRNQIVHRDLKPENVLLTNGRVVLTDFGIVKAFARNDAMGITSVRTQTQIVGTPGFMAPEQFLGRNIDHRADIFALGALLYFLTTDKLPFEGTSINDALKNLKRGIFVDPRRINPLLSPGFRAIVAKCLEPKPENRFNDAEELRQKILALLGSHGVSEVRQELVNYEENPAACALDQRTRAVDVLLRDLKVALSERDEDMAESILRWVSTLAPLDNRLLNVAGLSFDEDKKPVLKRRRARWLPPLALGLVLGLLFGAGAAVGWDIRHRLPPNWIIRIDSLSQSGSTHSGSKR